MAIKLKRGQAPGLAEGRPFRHKDGSITPRFRWIPRPGLRLKGYRGFYLLGEPGTRISDTEGGWAGLGFKHTPEGCEDITVDGPPLDLGGAVRAVQGVAKAIKAQLAAADAASDDAPAPAPRPAARKWVTEDWFDLFLQKALDGKVLKEQRNKKGGLDPIGPHTLATYQQGLARLRPIIGKDDPKDIRRADLKATFETLIAVNGWHTAVRAQRALSRAFSWLRTEAPAAAAALPQPEVYTKMGLGQPPGRLRMASPDEAAAMFDALSRPDWLSEQIARKLGEAVDPALTPAAAPGAAAAWLFGLWTCQRVNDVCLSTDHNVADNYFTLRQSKTKRPINIPLLTPAREAIDMARAARSGLGVRLSPHDHERLIFWDAQARLPYRQEKGPNSQTPGQIYFKRLNVQWVKARALAGLLVPSLLGDGLDPFGEPWAPLTLADSRDTGVTRLFEALGMDNEAKLAEIASWHGSSVENLLSLLKHYLVINPAFADRAGASLERHAKARGFSV